MKKGSWVLLLGMMTLGGVFLASCGGGSNLEDEQLTFVIDTMVGEVNVSRDGGESWEPARVSMFLFEDDMIETGEGSFCDVVMPDRGLFRVSAGTKVHLVSLTLADERLAVEKGSILVNVTEHLEEDQTFLVETSTAVAAVRGTQFKVSISDDGDSSVTVKDGEVAARQNIDLDDIADPALKKQVLAALDTSVQSSKKVVMTKEQNDKAEEVLEETFSESTSEEFPPEEVVTKTTEVLAEAGANLTVEDADDLSDFDDISDEVVTERIQAVSTKVEEVKEESGGSITEADYEALDDFVSGLESHFSGSSSTADEAVNTAVSDEEALEDLTSDLESHLSGGTESGEHLADEIMDDKTEQEAMDDWMADLEGNAAGHGVGTTTTVTDEESLDDFMNDLGGSSSDEESSSESGGNIWDDMF